jgi:hypothetical protein
MGKRPLFAGDRLRLKLDPGRFRHVAVYSVKGRTRPRCCMPATVHSRRKHDAAGSLGSRRGAGRGTVGSRIQRPSVSNPLGLLGCKVRRRPEVTVLPFVLPKSSSPDPTQESSP